MCAASQPFVAHQSASQPHYASPPSAGPSNMDRSSPVVPESQHPQPLEPDDVGHKHVTELSAQGIKLRDFAYETTLPPVTTVPRFSVQVQPRARPLSRTLKRTRDMLDPGHDGEESDEEDPNISRTFYIDANGTGMSRGYRYRKKGAGLERTLTEPADDVPPSQGFTTRALPPAQAPNRPQFCHVGSQSLTMTPQRPTRKQLTQSPSRLSMLSQSHQDESQETESWIDTPLVTPNGSLQWPVQNTSALPTSQLESVLPQLPDIEDNVTLSQLGFSPERSQQPPAASPAAPSPESRPATLPSSSRIRSPQLPPPPAFRTGGRAATSSKPRPPPAAPTRRSPRTGAATMAPLQEAAPPRYNLRQRTQAQPTPTPRVVSRTRASAQTSAPAKDKDKDKDKAARPSKKRKVTPPSAPSTSRSRSRARGTNGAVKENR